MQTAERQRNIGLAVVATGALAAIALWLVPVAEHTVMQAVLVCYASVAILLGGATAAFKHRELRASAGLARGEDVLAAWHLDEYAWRDFVQFDERLQREPGARPNELQPHNLVSINGIEITAGKSAVNIGGSVHTLPVRGTPEIQSAELNESRVRPSYVELQLKYPGGGSGASGIPREPSYTVLRFPVALSAMHDARRAVAHYNGDTPAEPDFFHGKGDGTDAEDLSTCWNCGLQTHKLRSECSRCGASLQSRRWSRRFGAIIAVLGSIVTVVMGMVLINMVPLLRRPGVDINGSRFSGSAGAALMILALLAAVFALGASMLGYGVFQVVTGRRNIRIVRIMVGVTVAILVVALLWPAG